MTYSNDDNGNEKVTTKYMNNRDPCPSGTTTIAISKNLNNEFSGQLSVDYLSDCKIPSDEHCHQVAKCFCSELFLVTEPISRVAVKHHVSAEIVASIYDDALDLLVVTKKKNYLWDFNGCYTYRHSPNDNWVMPYDA